MQRNTSIKAWCLTLAAIAILAAMSLLSISAGVGDTIASTFPDPQLAKAVAAEMEVGSNVNHVITSGDIAKVEMLSDMDFTGFTDLTGLSHLTQLEKLYLFNSPSLSSLPDEFAPLTKLTTLVIEDTQVSFLDPICKAANLATLSMKKNGLTAVPASFAQLTKLKSADLSENEISSLPANVLWPVGLANFNLSRNKLTQIPDGIDNLVGLQNFDLSYNRIGQISSDMKFLPQSCSINTTGNTYFPTAQDPSTVAIGDTVDLNVAFWSDFTGTVKSDVKAQQSSDIILMRPNHMDTSYAHTEKVEYYVRISATEYKIMTLEYKVGGGAALSGGYVFKGTGSNGSGYLLEQGSTGDVFHAICFDPFVSPGPSQYEKITDPSVIVNKLGLTGVTDLYRLRYIVAHSPLVLSYDALKADWPVRFRQQGGSTVNFFDDSNQSQSLKNMLHGTQDVIWAAFDEIRSINRPATGLSYRTLPTDDPTFYRSLFDPSDPAKQISNLRGGVTIAIHDSAATVTLQGTQHLAGPYSVSCPAATSATRFKVSGSGNFSLLDANKNPITDFALGEDFYLSVGPVSGTAFAFTVESTTALDDGFEEALFYSGNFDQTMYALTKKTTVAKQTLHLTTPVAPPIATATATASATPSPSSPIATPTPRASALASSTPTPTPTATAGTSGGGGGGGSGIPWTPVYPISPTASALPSAQGRTAGPHTLEPERPERTPSDGSQGGGGNAPSSFEPISNPSGGEEPSHVPDIDLSKTDLPDLPPDLPVPTTDGGSSAKWVALLVLVPLAIVTSAIARKARKRR